MGENFPNLVTLLSHCPHPLIFVNKLVCEVLVYSYFGLTLNKSTLITPLFRLMNFTRSRGSLSSCLLVRWGWFDNVFTSFVLI
jgi:hypothetical protein